MLHRDEICRGPHPDVTRVRSSGHFSRGSSRRAREGVTTRRSTMSDLRLTAPGSVRRGEIAMIATLHDGSSSVGASMAPQSTVSPQHAVIQLSAFDVLAVPDDIRLGECREIQPFREIVNIIVIWFRHLGAMDEESLATRGFPDRRVASRESVPQKPRSHCGRARIRAGSLPCASAAYGSARSLRSDGRHVLEHGDRRPEEVDHTSTRSTVDVDTRAKSANVDTFH